MRAHRLAQLLTVVGGLAAVAALHFTFNVNWRASGIFGGLVSLFLFDFLGRWLAPAEHNAFFERAEKARRGETDEDIPSPPLCGGEC